MTQGFSIEFFLNLNSGSIFNIKDCNMGNLLRVDCIKVKIWEDCIRIEFDFFIIYS